MPDIVWHGLQVEQPPRWDDPETRILAFTLTALAKEEADLHVILNMSDQRHAMALPPIPERVWRLAVDTAQKPGQDIIDPAEQKPVAENRYAVEPHSVVVFENAKQELAGGDSLSNFPRIFQQIHRPQTRRQRGLRFSRTRRPSPEAAAARFRRPQPLRRCRPPARRPMVRPRLPTNGQQPTHRSDSCQQIAQIPVTAGQRLPAEQLFDELVQELLFGQHQHVGDAMCCFLAETVFFDQGQLQPIAAPLLPILDFGQQFLDFGLPPFLFPAAGQ